MSLDPNVNIDWNRWDRDDARTNMELYDPEEGHVIKILQEAIAEVSDQELLCSFVKSGDFARVGELIGPLVSEKIDKAWEDLNYEIGQREETIDDILDL